MTMKAHTHEMNEGPDAFDKFRAAMKTIISVPKTAVTGHPAPRSKKKKAASRKG